MNTIKAIRDRLNITQTTLAEGMGCTQGNVGHYEHGQTVPPDAAKRLIAYAKTLGHTITFDDIYGGATPSDPDQERRDHERREAERREIETTPVVIIQDRRGNAPSVARPKHAKQRVAKRRAK